MDNNNIPLVIGNWYTQYSAGYWQLIDVKPKYATFDYESESVSWKKGDCLGNYAILKKAFTPKMKKGLRCECVDSSHLKSVSDDVLSEINLRFEQDPAYYSKFLSSSNEPQMYMANISLKLTSEEAQELKSKLATLPEVFTNAQLEFITDLNMYEKAFSASSGTHILYLWLHPWEITEKYDDLYRKAELVQLP